MFPTTKLIPSTHIKLHMRRITIFITLVTLISTKSMSQSTTPQKASWEPYNSYITAGAVTALGIIVGTRYPVEITPQIGPSINWFRNNTAEFNQFYNIVAPGQDLGIEFGNLIGYSAGATIGTVNPGINFKSGLFLERKGRSFSSQMWLDDTFYYTEGFSRINYFTIPFSIGASTDIRNFAISIDLGGFISFPVSEYHESTTNGVTSTFEPFQTVGIDGGILTDVGVKVPINESLSFKTNLRLASGLADNLRLTYGAYTQSAQILFGVSFKPRLK